MSEFDIFLEEAQRAAGKSNCASRHVGAVVVSNGKIITEGFNGVSSRFPDCVTAGCERCRTGGVVGVAYDHCICIHAEQRAIASAAAQGISTSGADLFLTLRPCLQCLLLIYAAEIKRIRYLEDWSYPDAREAAYRVLANRFEVFESVLTRTYHGASGRKVGQSEVQALHQGIRDGQIQKG
jgi:dCMP deaminase